MIILLDDVNACTQFKETLESETQRTFEVYEAIEYAYAEPPVHCRPPRCIVDSATLFIKVHVYMCIVTDSRNVNFIP